LHEIRWVVTKVLFVSAVTSKASTGLFLGFIGTILLAL
jgi:hypothetical protein